MSRKDELNALADRVEKGPPSRELDLKCETALHGLMAQITYPRRHSATEHAAGTAEILRALALMAQDPPRFRFD